MGKGTGLKTDDHQLNWRNSLRPLDPGILSDKENKKKERYTFNYIKWSFYSPYKSAKVHELDKMK